MGTQAALTWLSFKLRPWWYWLARILAVSLLGAAVSACGGISAVSDSPDLVVYGLSMVSADDGWAVGTADVLQARGMVAHYQDGSWKPVSLSGGVPALRSVFLLSASEGWAVGRRGAILHYHAGSWSQVASPVQADLSSVFMTSADEGWAVGQSILHYQRGEWTDVGSAIPGLNSVFMLSAREGWAVGAGGQIQHYTGGVWHTVVPSLESTHPSLNSVVFSSPSEGWAVGNQGTILHYQKGTWSDASLKDSDVAFSAVALVSASEGWAVGRTVSDSGRAGAIFHDIGGKWVQVHSPTHSEWNALDMVSADLGWAGGTQGNLLEYADGEWC